MTLDDTLVLRGISILIIILHNYIHWFSNVVLENQHVYYPERNKELSKWIWGLVMKYEKKEVSLKFREFMKRHADKLWLLLLPDHACSE